MLEWRFLIFLEFSIQGRVGWIGAIIFFSLFLNLSSPVLVWNEAWIVHVKFFYFFAIFFVIFYYGLGRKDPNDKFFFSLIRHLSRPVLAWNEAWMVLFNFLNFFSLFFWIFHSESGRNGWNDNFFSSLSRPVPTRFGLKWSLNGALKFF